MNPLAIMHHGLSQEFLPPQVCGVLCARQVNGKDDEMGSGYHWLITVRIGWVR
jgi:hypothetical protein